MFISDTSDKDVGIRLRVFRIQGLGLGRVSLGVIPRYPYSRMGGVSGLGFEGSVGLRLQPNVPEHCLHGEKKLAKFQQNRQQTIIAIGR